MADILFKDESYRIMGAMFVVYKVSFCALNGTIILRFKRYQFWSFVE